MAGALPGPLSGKVSVPPASQTSVVKLHCKLRHVAMGHVRLRR